uniref:Uncharacterized protein n=1 Tax=Rhizophora mucronata TaxID=61149 RepID=A0A2P2PL73_RHIMU
MPPHLWCQPRSSRQGSDQPVMGYQQHVGKLVPW